MKNTIKQSMLKKIKDYISMPWTHEPWICSRAP